MNVKLSEAQKLTQINGVEAYKIMQQVLLRENHIRRGQEHFWVMGLNNANKLLFVELVSLGATNRVDVHPPDVFRMAIYKLAVKVILVHNHPSGSTTVNKVDKNFTDRLLKVGELIAIDVVDHLIISEKSYISYAALGIIDELRKLNTFRLLDQYQQEFEKMKVDAEKKEALKKHSMTIAKRMLKKNYEIAEITKLTGLTQKQVEGLKK